MVGSTATATISDNSISGNGVGTGQIGIDLLASGDSHSAAPFVTPNDVGDGDDGANDLFNFPVITSATESGGTVTIDFDLDVPAGDYRIEFFTNSAPNPSGYGEGETLVDTYNVVGHPGGAAAYSTSFAGSLGEILTATTTEGTGAPFGPTSEFSKAAVVLEPVVLDTVYHGTVVLPDGSTSVMDAIGASIDNSKAILTFGTESPGNAPADTEVMGVYSGPGTLGFSRVGTGGDVTIHWNVAVFSSGVNVQRGSILLNGTNQIDLSLTPVDTSRAFVIASHKVGGSDFDGSSFLSARLLDSDSLRLRFQDNRNDQSVMWQVVEYSQAAVQSGTLTLASGEGSAVAPISVVDPAKSWLTYSYSATAGTTSNIGQKLVSGLIADPTTLQFVRLQTGNAVDIAWSLVEFTDAAEVQRGGVTLPTEPSAIVPISPVDPSRAFPIGGYRGSGGASDYAGDDVPGVARFTAELTAFDELTLTRGSTAAGGRVGWFVVHWPGANIAPSFDQDLTDRTDAEANLDLPLGEATDPDMGTRSPTQRPAFPSGCRSTPAPA